MTTEVIMPRAGRIRNKIVDYLAKHPGSTSEVISEALGVSNAASSSALNSMFNAGLVSRRRTGKFFAYMLKAEERSQFDLRIKKLPPVDPKQYTLLMPVPSQPDVSELERRLAELEAFKAEVVAKHPDLIQIDYEAYRPALAEFYKVCCCEISIGAQMDQSDKNYINGLIAAAKLFPENAG